MTKNTKISKIVTIGNSQGITISRQILKNMGFDRKNDLMEYTLKKVHKNKK